MQIWAAGAFHLAQPLRSAWCYPPAADVIPCVNPPFPLLQFSFTLTAVGLSARPPLTQGFLSASLEGTALTWDRNQGSDPDLHSVNVFFLPDHDGSKCRLEAGCRAQWWDKARVYWDSLGSSPGKSIVMGAWRVTGAAAWGEVSGEVNSWATAL